MNIRLSEIDGACVSTRLSDTGYMDAAVAGDMAGLEVALDSVTVTTAPNPRYATNDGVLTIAMHRERMKQLLVLLADKLELPAFNASEWLAIARALRYATANQQGHEFEAMADAIEAQYR